MRFASHKWWSQTVSVGHKQFKSISKCCDHKARFLQRANNLSGFMPKVERLLYEAPTKKRWPRRLSGRNNVPVVPSPEEWLQNMCGKRLRAYLHGFQRAIVSGSSVVRSRTPKQTVLIAIADNPRLSVAETAIWNIPIHRQQACFDGLP